MNITSLGAIVRVTSVRIRIQDSRYCLISRTLELSDLNRERSAGLRPESSRAFSVRPSFWCGEIWELTDDETRLSPLQKRRDFSLA